MLKLARLTMLESFANELLFRFCSISVAKFAVLLFLDDRLELFLTVYDMLIILGDLLAYFR